MLSFFGRSTSRNLILIQQTSTQLTLQRGEPRRSSKKVLGLEPQVLGAIALALMVGIFAIYQHNQKVFYSNTNLVFHWLPVCGPIVIAAMSVAGQLGAVTHEALTFDKSAGTFLQEGESALGKKVIKQFPLDRIVDIELIEYPDDGGVSYGINIRLQSRKKIFPRMERSAFDDEAECNYAASLSHDRPRSPGFPVPATARTAIA